MSERGSWVIVEAGIRKDWADATSFQKLSYANSKRGGLWVDLGRPSVQLGREGRVRMHWDGHNHAKYRLIG
jgi:hypothetical protein